MNCDQCKFSAKSKSGLTLHKKTHTKKNTEPVLKKVDLSTIPLKNRFIDLFCGIGGFHQALSSLGYTCVFASDIDSSCQSSYEKNYNIKPVGDINEVVVSDIPPFNILCAGFPCQPFSKAGQQKGFEDDRGHLFFSICRIIKHHTPSYVILENVRNLATHDNGHTWKVIRSSLHELGYITYEDPLILNALHVNVPQNRERVVILCQRNDIGPLPLLSKLPSAKSQLTSSLKDVLEVGQPSTIPKKLVHVESVWNDFLLLLIKHAIPIPKFPIWTEWWDRAEDDSNEYHKYKNWITKNKEWYHLHQAILEPWLSCSRKDPLWKGAVRKLEWQAGDLLKTDSMRTILWSVRGSGIRIKRPDYIPTLVAMKMTPIYGAEQRYLTARELLRLQSFPDTFQYDPKHIHKQVGNSVNVKMIKQCASFLLNHTPLL
jgi:DNA (cytosine-5)-methyltransferase 1